MKKTDHTTFAHLELPALRRLAAGAMLCCAASAVTTLALPLSASAQETANAAALSFVNADIESVIKAIGHYTGMTFIIDPRVKGTLTLVSEKSLSKSASLRPADVDPAPAGLRGGHQRRRLRQGGARGRSQAAIVAHASGRRALEQGDRRPDRHAGVLPVVRIGRQPHGRAAAADFAEQLDHGQPGQQHPGRDRLRRQPAPPGHASSPRSTRRWQPIST